jgi:CBS domain containing-hemolysin-like protein
MFEFYLSIIGFVLSILFSSSEIALISSNELQINVWKKQKIKLANIALNILKAKDEYLSLILIGTNIANTMTVTFSTIYLVNYFSDVMLFFLITIFILLFAEILPKTFFSNYANYGILILSPFLLVSRLILYPVLFFLKQLEIKSTINLSRSLIDHVDDKRDDLEHVYSEINDEGLIEKDQKDMISNVFDLGESNIADAMTNRTEISAISISASLEDLLHAFIDSGHSKIPVYKDSLDNIVGVTYLYDLYDKPESVKEIIKPIAHIPYTKNMVDILEDFQSSHRSIAVVVDEHGGTSGIITIEDIFEELFGDFSDEFDDDNSELIKRADGSFIVDAKTNYKKINETINNIEIPEGEYESIGGYIINKIGRIPNQGETLFLPIGQIVINKSSARKIIKVQIYTN